MLHSPDVDALAQQLRPLLKICIEKKRFLKTFSTFNKHAYHNDKSKTETAIDDFNDAERKALKLLDGATPETIEALAKVLLPLLAEDNVDPISLLSSNYPIIAEMGKGLTKVKETD